MTRDRTVLCRLPTPDVRASLALILLCVMSTSCDTERGPAGPAEGKGGETRAEVRAPALFLERAVEAGIDFVHDNGASGEFYYPELMQGGAAFFDYDNDDLLDIYLVQSGRLPLDGNRPPARNRLYRNLGAGQFVEATEASGLGDPGYGSGVAVADYDQDGWLDVYVTNLGPNRLYRNRGGGAFEDVTERAGAHDSGYSTAAVFFDAEGDGDLDLFVTNYVSWSPEVETTCLGFHGLRGYCSPGEYSPQSDTLYRNNGNGTFTDISGSSGIRSLRGAGLGAAARDFTGDGLVDLYVANDQMANFLWVNQGGGRFAEEALLRGAALNDQGRPEAGMGVIAEDFDDDGDADLLVTHLSGETNTFYQNDDGGFRDLTDRLGLGAISQAYTGFGVGYYDFDLDGRRDLFLANGKVSPGDSVEPDYAEPNQLLLGNADGSFRPSPPFAAIDLVEVSRAAAFGDYDNDGDIDILVNNNGGPTRLLENQAADAAPRSSHWLTVELRSSSMDRDVIGARVEIEIRGGDRGERRRLTRWIQPSSSYCASNDPRLHFGLGALTQVDGISVTWPDGRREELGPTSVDQFLRIEK